MGRDSEGCPEILSGMFAPHACRGSVQSDCAVETRPGKIDANPPARSRSYTDGVAKLRRSFFFFFGWLMFTDPLPPSKIKLFIFN